MMKKKLKNSFLHNTRSGSIIYSTILLVALSIGLASCGGSNDNRLEYSGTIESTDIVVSSQIPGQVEKLFYDEGDAVLIGDTLAIIDYDKFALQLIQAEATKKSLELKLNMLEKGARKEDRKLAREQLTQAEANYKLAKKNKDRMTKLHKTESITRQQYDEALLAYKVAESKFISAKQNLLKSKSARPEQVEQIKANISQSEAAINLIKKNINDCYIIAPFTGQIVNRFVEEKELVSFLSSMFKIIDLTKSELTIYVPETDLANINLGNKVTVNIDAFNDKSFEGKITFISPEAEFTPKNIQTKDERTKLVFAVKIKIDNPEKILKAGMPADAIIDVEN